MAVGNFIVAMVIDDVRSFIIPRSFDWDRIGAFKDTSIAFGFGHGK